MRHNRDFNKLNRTAAHRKAMLANMVTSLFAEERIKTTTAKAKEAKSLAERMITFARRGDLSARRQVAKTVRDRDVLKKLFEEIAPRYATRPGGYTRILRLGNLRLGDGSKMAFLSLLGKDEEGRKKKKRPRKTYHKFEIPESPAAMGKPEAPESAVPAAEAATSGEGAAAEAPAAEAAVKTPEPEAQAKGEGAAPGAGEKGKKEKAAKGAEAPKAETVKKAKPAEAKPKKKKE
jgi:large subunit ribosomal protein L17